MAERDLKTSVALYFPSEGKVTAKGVAGAKETVRVLLNPIIPKGMSDDQIFENFAKIQAVDKKEIKNAGQFSVDLNAGTATDPNFTVVIATAQQVARPRVRTAGFVAEVVDSPAAVLQPGTGQIKVTGVAGATETVRLLLNLVPNGIPDNQMFARFAEFVALDKKEKPNAGSFTVNLDTHGTPSPYAVAIATADGNVARPVVEMPSGGGSG